jgi:hypothetical protein
LFDYLEKVKTYGKYIPHFISRVVLFLAATSVSNTFCSDDSKFSEKITPCCLVNMYGRFKGLWWLHIDGQTVQGAMSIDR